MKFLPVLLSLLAAAQARSIFQLEGENDPEGACHCDRRFLRHYEARGCVADALDSCGCPRKFSCPPPNANDSSSLEVCIYRGEEYAPGSRVRTAEACQVCRCLEGAPPRLSCVTRECPQLPATDGDNCHPVYAENKCCPLRYECLGNEIEDDVQAAASKTCRHGDRVYPFGAKIQAADDPCLVCTCDERWGSEGENRTCVELDCVMERHQHKLEEGCVPVYHEGRCCPIQFYCPASPIANLPELPISEETNTTHDDRCFFGGRYYDRGEELSTEDHPCVQCTCAIPPHPSCVHRTCPPPPAPGCGRVHRPGQCCPDYECMLGDEPPAAEEEECPTPMCEHSNCRVAVPPGEKCPTCVCGEMVSELEHNNLEQPAQYPLQQVAQGIEEMEPPSQFISGAPADDSSEGGLQLMPLVMEERSVQQLSNSSSEEESDKEINEEDVDNGKGLPEMDGEELRGKRNGTLIINEIWTIDHDIEVPPGCPTPMCEGHWCRILIPEDHNCPTCICKQRFDVDNEP